MHREHHAAFGGAVELGEHHAGQWDDFAKILCLTDGVLPGGGIEDQERLVRRIGDDLFHHAADLGQFFHEIDFRLQAAGGIDDHHISAAGFGCRDSIKSHRRRISPFGMLHDVSAGALCPDGELLRSSRAEGVCCRQENFLSFLMETTGELADGGGLAHPVDAYHQNDFRMVAIFLIDGVILQKLHHRLFHERHDFIGMMDGALGDAAANLSHQVVGGTHTDVAGEEHHFQIFQKLFIDGGIADDYALDIADEALLGLGESFFNFVKKSHMSVLLWFSLIVSFSADRTLGGVVISDQ